jgi:hypothetical protein
MILFLRYWGMQNPLNNGTGQKRNIDKLKIMQILRYFQVNVYEKVTPVPTSGMPRMRYEIEFSMQACKNAGAAVL